MKALSKMKIALIACLVLLAGGYFAGSIVQAAADRKAVVVDVNGVADVQRAGSSQWVPAERGMQLAAGDTLRTTLDSTIDIRLEDGSALRLDEETKLTIEGLSTETEKSRFLFFMNRPVEAKKAKLKLAEGKILANVRRLPNSQSAFRVETPKGVAGVRGTNWFVGTKELGVQEGFINWTRNQDEASKQQTWETLIRDFFAGPFKKTADEESDVPRTRVNEGLAANIAEDGALVDWQVIPEQMLEEMRDFFETVYAEVPPPQASTTTAGGVPTGGMTGGLPTTVTQSESNEYITQEIIGDAGGASGAETSGSTISDSQRAEQNLDQRNPELTQDSPANQDSQL